MLALADTISLVEINGLARSLLSYVSHFGREEDAWAEYTEDPEAWSDMGPTYATAIVACIPAFMDDSGLSTGNGPVLQRGATLTTMEHMDGSVGTLTSDFESESDDDVPEGAVRFELEAEEIQVSGFGCGGVVGLWVWGLCVGVCRHTSCYNKHHKYKQYTIYTINIIYTIYTTHPYTQAALLEVGGDVAPPLDVEVPNSLLPHDELEALIAQRQPRFVALDGSEDVRGMRVVVVFLLLRARYSSRMCVFLHKTHTQKCTHNIPTIPPPSPQQNAHRATPSPQVTCTQASHNDASPTASE